MAWSTSYEITVKNCVNYGTITNAGYSGYCDIGGVVGHCRETIKVIQNCFNYGIIRHTGTTPKSKIVGGIVGYMYSESSIFINGIIENSIYAGKIEMNTEDRVFVGGLLGCMDGNVNLTVKHSFWTEGDMYCKLCGNKNPSINLIDSGVSELNSTIMDELFDYAEESGSGNENIWGKKHILHLNGGKISNFTQDAMAVIGKQFPIPVKDENTFLFWCEDKECNAIYDSTNNTSNTSDVYAAWNTSTVTFDFENGTVIEGAFLFKNAIAYPEDAEMIREGYTFDEWSPRPDIVTGYDIIVTAKWDPNEYNITFVFANGTVIEDVLEYNTTIAYPEEGEMRRDGYTFVGWDVNDEFVPADKLTITAQWTPNNYTVTLMSTEEMHSPRMK